MAELNGNLAFRNERNSLDKCLKTVGMSSLFADTNFVLPNGAFLDKSGSTDMESYLTLPSSPKPFSSSNLSSLVMDTSCVFSQNTLVDQSNQQGHKRQKLQQVARPGALVEHKSQDHLLSLLIGMKQEPSTLMQVAKKRRMDMNLDDLLQQQIQQLLLKEDIEQLQDNNTQLKALIQHYMQNKSGQQMVISTPNACATRAQQSEQRVRNQLRQQATHHNSSMQSSDDGICSQRLTQYIYNLRNRPKDNSIDYWRKFVSEFYAPGAKERWCLSSYENLGQHVLGILSLGTMDAWCCDICGTKSGKGFEANFEMLPRLCKMKFEGEAVEEILFLEFPREFRFLSGMMMLEYGNAVQESVYEQFRVVREGKLCVIFRHDLKILSWEFCAYHHEEYLPRRLVAPLVNQLINTAHKYQTSLANTASGRVSTVELQEICNMFMKFAHQVVRHMDLPMLKDLGFSKRHVRCLQIAEVVNSMKKLMDFSIKRRIGPIESLRTYPHAGINRNILGSAQTEGQATVAKRSIQDTQIDGIRSTPKHLGPESHCNNTCMNRIFSSSEDVQSMLTDYYQKIPRDRLSNTIGCTPKSEQSCLVDRSSQRAIPSPFDGQPSKPGPFHGSLLSSLLSSQTSGASQNIQQHMIDKWLKEMVAESRLEGLQNAFGQQKDQAMQEFNANIISGLPSPARGRDTINNRPGFENSRAAALAQANYLASSTGTGGISRTAATSTPEISGNNSTIKREPGLPEFIVTEAFLNMGANFSKNDI